MFPLDPTQDQPKKKDDDREEMQELKKSNSLQESIGRESIDVPSEKDHIEA
jgi:hypothetical protein